MVDNLKYRVKPSKFDNRDFVYTQKFSAIKQSVDLRNWDSAVEDQDLLGSCVGNAIASGYELMVKQLYPDNFVELSRLFIYYNARLFSDTTDEDVGAYVRDGFKAVKLYGVCREDLWPYNIEKFDNKPNSDCYIDAAHRRITEYRSLTTLRDMLETLSDNHPIIIGFGVYSSFNSISKDNPIISMPSTKEEYIGGHAVSVVGYDLTKQQFLIKNSYGVDWADNGYAWLPFEYVRTEGFEKWRFEISSQPPLFK